MDAKVKEVLLACTQGSDAERLSFPEVVRALTEAGVERYHADLQRSEKTYYLPNGESLSLPAHRLEVAPAMAFSAAGVEAAVRAIQARKIGYRAFCAQIAEAGCVDYWVSLAGRRAIYSGRTGESFVEPFPTAR